MALSHAKAALAPCPLWVGWAINPGMVNSAGDFAALPAHIQTLIKQKYMENEAKKLGVYAQQAPPLGGLGNPMYDPLLQDHLNSLTGIPARGTQGPYIPMSDVRKGPTNRHNKWFAKMDIDPIMLLGLRLRMGEGEAPLPFAFYTSYCNESYVWISYVVDNELITLKDDAHLFPSDELIATLKLAIEAFSR